jgi:hypothetical protein
LILPASSNLPVSPAEEGLRAVRVEAEDAPAFVQQPLRMTDYLTVMVRARLPAGLGGLTAARCESGRHPKPDQ